VSLITPLFSTTTNQPTNQQTNNYRRKELRLKNERKKEMKNSKLYSKQTNRGYLLPTTTAESSTGKEKRRREAKKASRQHSGIDMSVIIVGFGFRPRGVFLPFLTPIPPHQSIINQSQTSNLQSTSVRLNPFFLL